MEAPQTRAHELQNLPLDQLPEPLVPGGYAEEEPAAFEPIVDVEPDYDALVRMAAAAALTVLLAKIAWILLIANFEGATIGIQFARGILPYFAIFTDPDTFTTIVTMSTAGMAFAAVVLMVLPTIRPSWNRMQIWGISLGLALTFETFMLELFRHYLWSNVIRLDLAWITLFELLIGAGLLLLALKTPRYVADNQSNYMPLPAWEHVLEENET